MRQQQQPCPTCLGVGHMVYGAPPEGFDDNSMSVLCSYCGGTGQVADRTSGDPYIPVCDACGTPLMIHADSAAGAACDLALSLSQLAHDGLKALGIDYIEWRKRGNQIIDEEERERLQ